MEIENKITEFEEEREILWEILENFGFNDNKTWHFAFVDFQNRSDIILAKSMEEMIHLQNHYDFNEIKLIDFLTALKRFKIIK